MAALVRSLVDGEIGQAGAWMPEQVVHPSVFFSRLACRDLDVVTTCASGRAGPVVSSWGRRPDLGCFWAMLSWFCLVDLAALLAPDQAASWRLSGRRGPSAL
jgi:hypothetical protein